MGVDLDESALDDMCDGDREFECELLETFVACQETAMADLTAALQRGDYEALKKIAHFTKGGSRSVGGARLGNVAESLESAMSQADYTEAGKLVREAQQAYACLKIVIENRTKA